MKSRNLTGILGGILMEVQVHSQVDHETIAEFDKHHGAEQNIHKHGGLEQRQ